MKTLNIITMITSIFLVLSLALIAFVYFFILGRGILNFWWRFGLKYFEKTFIYKPVWGCVVCLSGQLSLWVYVLNWIRSETGNNVFFNYLFKIIPIYQPNQFTFFLMVLFVSATMTTTLIITKLLEKWT